MIQETNNQSLKHLNTFGFDVKAKQYFSIASEEELLKILKKIYADDLFILGGGSNILLTEDLNLSVLHINIKGISVISENNDFVIIKAAAGENWHHFVRHCVSKGYGGIENLSLIPGNVGTAPIQNIGAYGVEMQDTFMACETVNVQTLEKRVFSKQDCHFGYRNSIFKNELKGQYIITNVTFRLTKKHHKIYTNYGAINSELEALNIKYPSIEDVSDAVIKIRTEKLPDPKKIGNSGSFFKNPIISKPEFEELQKRHPDIRYYKVNERAYKIPAGWLIDQVGFKGFREGDAGVHQNQALVLVNYGKATGKDILNLAEKIKRKIKSTYGLNLEMEVNIVP